MVNRLKKLCQATKKHSHRQPMPGYEDSHVLFENRARLINILSTYLPVNKIADGWQFYISIESPYYLSKAWRLLEGILLNEESGILGIALLDVSGFNHSDRHAHYAHGKQIILYTFKDASGNLLQTPTAFFNTLRQVEAALRNAEIPAGPMARAAMRISGSRYIASRHTIDEEQQYVETDRAMQYENPSNPFYQTNHYANCTIRSRSPRRPFFAPASQEGVAGETALRDAPLASTSLN